MFAQEVTDGAELLIWDLASDRRPGATVDEAGPVSEKATSRLESGLCPFLNAAYKWQRWYTYQHW